MEPRASSDDATAGGSVAATGARVRQMGTGSRVARIGVRSMWFQSQCIEASRSVAESKGEDGDGQAEEWQSEGGGEGEGAVASAG